MSRFKIDDRVEINSVIHSKHIGRQGRIKTVIPNARGKQTLDRYVVLFNESEEDKFWDIQLVLVSPPVTGK